jgi:hypothetical protein
VILSAEVDSNNSALIIEGSGFGTGAVVTLGTTRLNVQTATDTKIISTLFADAFLPGAYILRAQFSNGMLAMFVLPLGTVKPAGGCGTHRPTIILNLLTSAPQVGVPTVLQATATDQDLAVCGPAEYLSYSWKFLDFPAFSQTSFSTLGSMPTFIPDLGGTYTILGTVTDSTGRSASAAITIVVALPPPA